jgi:hypothetical protein
MYISAVVSFTAMLRFIISWSECNHMWRGLTFLLFTRFWSETWEISQCIIPSAAITNPLLWIPQAQHKVIFPNWVQEDISQIHARCLMHAILKHMFALYYMTEIFKHVKESLLTLCFLRNFSDIRGGQCDKHTKHEWNYEFLIHFPGFNTEHNRLFEICGLKNKWCFSVKIAQQSAVVAKHFMAVSEAKMQFLKHIVTVSIVWK